jgi:hypothetical protein
VRRLARGVCRPCVSASRPFGAAKRPRVRARPTPCVTKLSNRIAVTKPDGVNARCGTPLRQVTAPGSGGNPGTGQPWTLPARRARSWTSNPRQISCTWGLTPRITHPKKDVDANLGQVVGQDHTSATRPMRRLRRGAKLSLGQRQRTGLARALYSEPALLDLGEATRALDTQTEAAAKRTLRQLGGDSLSWRSPVGFPQSGIRTFSPSKW